MKCRSRIMGSTRLDLNWEKFEALVARLEAAEKMCDFIGKVPDLGNMDWFREGDRLFQEWLKAAGK
jgi:hypothetical protein